MDVTFDCIPNARELVAIEYLRCASSLDFKLSLSESVTFFTASASTGLSDYFACISHHCIVHFIKSSIAISALPLIDLPKNVP